MDLMYCVTESRQRGWES